MKITRMVWALDLGSPLYPEVQLPRIPLLETVWKIFEGFSTVRVWWQKRPVETPLCPLGASRISISGPISIFQTVSLRTPVNRACMRLHCRPRQSSRPEVAHSGILFDGKVRHSHAQINGSGGKRSVFSVSSGYG